MTRIYTIAALVTLATVQGFAPSMLHGARRMTSLSATITTELPPYFLDAPDTSATSSPDVVRETPRPAKKAAPPKKKAPAHKEGIFSPVVLAAKRILGEAELNRIRGNAIALHSDTIKSFVGTAESNFGMTVLRALYKMADRNGNDKMEEEELAAFLQTLGFSFLGEKQIHGIFSRAGGEEKGFITLEEWIAEAPRTLKTNLVKLAKTNGGELGFLV